MMSALDDLVSLMPPSVSGSPQTPPWHRSSSEIAIEFPDDFKEFVRAYGFGSINDYLHLVPIYSEPADLYSGFRGFVKRTLDIGANSPDGDLGDSGPSLYPADGGLVLWATDDGGDLYFWLREGANSNLWPVMVWLRGSAEWRRFDDGMAACLLAILREEFPWPGSVLNPEPEWEHARTNPLWEYFCDWSFCP
jgi:hypothetical protein